MSQTSFTAEDLYLYSMHLLEPEESQRLKDFLQRSSEARAELLNVRRDLALLALSAEPQAVPEVSRHRFLNQVARERRAVPQGAAQSAAQPVKSVPVPVAVPLVVNEDEDRYTPAVEAQRPGQVFEDEPRRGFFGTLLPWAGWAVAAGLAFTTWTFHQHTLGLSRQLIEARDVAVRSEDRSARAQTVLDTLRSDSSQRFLLTAQGTPPAPSARVTYLASAGSVVFQGNNLDSLPAEKTYELWLIPTEKDAKPIAAGTFKPDARGYASLILPGLPKGVTAGTFGVTMEEDGGSQTPTLPILLVGA